MNLFILTKPIISEKSARLMSERNTYTFEVALNATKGQIKEAVESIFKVTVKDITTATVHGKTRRRGARRTSITMPNRKKAMVRLAEGQKIEMMDLKPEGSNA